MCVCVVQISALQKKNSMLEVELLETRQRCDAMTEENKQLVATIKKVRSVCYPMQCTQPFLRVCACWCVVVLCYVVLCCSCTVTSSVLRACAGPC